MHPKLYQNYTLLQFKHFMLSSNDTCLSSCAEKLRSTFLAKLFQVIPLENQSHPIPSYKRPETREAVLELGQASQKPRPWTFMLCSKCIYLLCFIPWGSHFVYKASHQPPPPPPPPPPPLSKSLHKWRLMAERTNQHRILDSLWFSFGFRFLLGS